MNKMNREERVATLLKTLNESLPDGVVAEHLREHKYDLDKFAVGSYSFGHVVMSGATIKDLDAAALVAAFSVEVRAMLEEFAAHLRGLADELEKVSNELA